MKIYNSLRSEFCGRDKADCPFNHFTSQDIFANFAENGNNSKGRVPAGG